MPFHTSDDIMRIEGIPDRLVVLGGGFIAAELSHVFDAMGSTVTVVNRNRRLLRLEDDDVPRRYTEVMGRRFELVLGGRSTPSRRMATASTWTSPAKATGSA